MALVNVHTAKKSTKIKVNNRSHVIVAYSKETIDTPTRDAILKDIVNFLALNPKATKIDITQNTLDIATKYHISKYVVAGVRASFTRKTYGNPKRLVSNKRAANLKSAKAKTNSK